MRKITVLKACLDFIYFFGILTFVFMTLFAGATWFSADAIPIEINGFEIEMDHWSSKLLLTLTLVGSGLFLYAIYLLRETILLFRQRIIFDQRVIHNFNRIGWCIISATLTSYVPLFIHSLIHRTNRGFRFSATLSTDSFLVSVSLGLLFMVISQIFAAGKSLKEDQELTV